MSLLKMFGGVFVLRVVAAADVAAGETETKMNPGVSHLETFFTAIRCFRSHILDLVEMDALLIHFYLSS